MGVVEEAFAAAVSPSGVSDSGLVGEAVDCCGLDFARTGCCDLAALLAGRSRGTGTGSAGRAAWICAATRAKLSAAATIGRNAFTFPPK